MWLIETILTIINTTILNLNEPAVVILNFLEATFAWFSILFFPILDWIISFSKQMEILPQFLIDLIDFLVYILSNPPGGDFQFVLNPYIPIPITNKDTDIGMGVGIEHTFMTFYQTFDFVPETEGDFSMPIPYSDIIIANNNNTETVQSVIETVGGTVIKVSREFFHGVAGVVCEAVSFFTAPIRAGVIYLINNEFTCKPDIHVTFRDGEYYGFSAGFEISNCYSSSPIATYDKLTSKLEVSIGRMVTKPEGKEAINKVMIAIDCLPNTFEAFELFDAPEYISSDPLTPEANPDLDDNAPRLIPLWALPIVFFCQYAVMSLMADNSSLSIIFRGTGRF